MAVCGHVWFVVLEEGMAEQFPSNSQCLGALWIVGGIHMILPLPVSSLSLSFCSLASLHLPPSLPPLPLSISLPPSLPQSNNNMKPKEGEITSRPWHWPLNLQVLYTKLYSHVFIKYTKFSTYIFRLSPWWYHLPYFLLVRYLCVWSGAWQRLQTLPANSAGLRIIPHKMPKFELS